MDALFGNMETITKFFVAFVVALGLMALSFWLFRRLTGQRLGGGATRGRQPRLAVIDAAVVDARRRLVLVRRDNVEHLLMIGGPSDVVIEQNIVRAVPIAASRELPSAAARGNAGAEAVARGPEIGVPRADTGPSWPLQPEAPRAEPEPPAIRPRPPRLTEPDAMPRAPRIPEPEPMPRAPRLADPELIAPRAEPAMPRVAAAGEPPSRPERPPFRSSPPMPGTRPEPPLRTVEPRAAPATADVNLADMAQRLEAALRRPAAAAEPRPEPRNAEPSPRPAPIAEPPAAREPARPEPPRAAPSERPRPADAEVKTEPKPEPKPDARPASPKSVLDSLEQEMASLLGRPSGKE